MKRTAERKFSNRIFLGNVWVRPLAGGSPLAANAVSLNRGGLTLFCNRSLEVGQTVELQNVMSFYVQDLGGGQLQITLTLQYLNLTQSYTWIAVDP
jgi:hypothetical protein